MLSEFKIELATETHSLVKQISEIENENIYFSLTKLADYPGKLCLPFVFIPKRGGVRVIHQL